jgi:arginyl-tRNA synthetase
MKIMKFEISKGIYEKKSFCVVFAKDINNRTAKSRDIILKLEKLKDKKRLPNINPFVNFLNAFTLENDVEGIYADLDSIYGDLKLERLKSKIPFLPAGKREVVFCDQGEEVFSDEHSVTHRFEGYVQGQRVKVTGEIKNLFVCLALEKESMEKLQQLVSSFAKEGEDLFGGIWKVLIGNPVEIDFETKQLDEKLVVISDLEKLAESEIKGNKGLKKRRGESLGFVNENTVVHELNALIAPILKKLYPALNLENRIILSKSPNLKFGHFSTNIAFELSKILDEKLPVVAEELAMKLRGETRVASVFSKIEVVQNGFVNFFLSDKYLFDSAFKALADFEPFSSCNIGKGRVILIESPSANPNKAMHVGHLLNVFLAQSLKVIFEKLGFEVHNDNIINDKGLPICKAMWALKKYASDSSPEKEGLKSDHFVDKYYVLGAKKFKESKEVESEVRELLLKWENGDEQTIALWKQMISWVLEGHKKTMKRLGEEMGHMWFESEIYDVGKKIVKENIDGERIVETSDGAVVAKLEREYGVPDVVLLKSDGTSLYHTQDLGLTTLKIEKFNPWLAIWVVGNEQITHFQRLFSLIDSLGLLPIDNLYHLAYGYVFDKNGKKMSSRGGEVLSGDELLDIIEDATKNEDVALGALKYAFLSSDPFKDMKFDLEKAVQFSGKSGPYVMYAHARASNILKSVKDESKNLDSVELSDLNREILLKCLDYPNVITSSANNFSPSILAEYLYDLAKLFSQMYETEKVLDAKGAEKMIRVLIVKFVKRILNDGLLLLRIKPLEQM